MGMISIKFNIVVNFGEKFISVNNSSSFKKSALSFLFGVLQLHCDNVYVCYQFREALDV